MAQVIESFLLNEIINESKAIGEKSSWVVKFFS
ncbi:MAG: hypothetical protein ACJAVF_003544 [Paraglaciecola sp.]|jgi:hypothetical protein